MLLITSADRPARCARCNGEIAVLIIASTPRNRRPHIVQIPTAYHRATDGAIVCPDCWADELAERALILTIAAAGEAQAEPVYSRPQPERRNGGTPQPAPELCAVMRIRQNGQSGQDGRDAGGERP